MHPCPPFPKRVETVCCSSSVDEARPPLLLRLSSLPVSRKALISTQLTSVNSKAGPAVSEMGGGEIGKATPRRVASREKRCRQTGRREGVPQLSWPQVSLFADVATILLTPTRQDPSRSGSSSMLWIGLGVGTVPTRFYLYVCPVDRRGLRGSDLFAEVEVRPFLRPAAHRPANGWLALTGRSQQELRRHSPCKSRAGGCVAPSLD
jgi:hypothetical protein